MIQSILSRLRLPPNPVGRAEQLRACGGAFFGLLLAGVLSGMFAAFLSPAVQGAGVILMAPIGASAVLLFCLPGSPLAQPWSILGGNIVSGLIGLACVRLLGDGLIVGALAVALAIAAMLFLRCLHPPSGAVALIMVLGGPAVHAAGLHFLLAPLALNSLLLVAAAIVYNNLTGRRYPHFQQPLKLKTGLAEAGANKTGVRLGFTSADLDLVLKNYNQVLDVSRDDLESLFLQTETQAYRRRFGVITCADIMSRDGMTAEFGTQLDVAWRQMRMQHLAVMPVLNRARRVIGVVTQDDFLLHSGMEDFRSLGQRVQRFLLRSGASHSEKAEVIGQIMKAHPVLVCDSTPIIELIPLMANAGVQHILITDSAARFAGIVTESDLVAALYQSSFAEMAAAPATGADPLAA